MPQTSIQRRRIATVILLSTVLQLPSAFAENRIQPKKGSDHSFTIELTNTDVMEGFQFCLKGRGGIACGSCEGTERTSAAGLELYQYLANDSCEMKREG